MTPYQSQLLEVVLRRYLSPSFAARVLRDVDEAFARASEMNLRETLRPVRSELVPSLEAFDSETQDLRATAELGDIED